MEYIEELFSKVEKTKIARFQASRRMKRNRNSSNTMISLMSAYIILLNLLGFSDKFNDGNKITILTIGLSVIILVITLLVGQLNYAQREDNYHRCGNELNMLLNEILLIIKGNQQIEITRKKDLTNRYDNILSKYNLNHIEIDYEYGVRKHEDRVNVSTWFLWHVFSMNVLYYFGAFVIAIICLLIILLT